MLEHQSINSSGGGENGLDRSRPFVYFAVTSVASCRKVAVLTELGEPCVSSRKQTDPMSDLGGPGDALRFFTRTPQVIL